MDEPKDGWLCEISNEYGWLANPNRTLWDTDFGEPNNFLEMSIMPDNNNNNTNKEIERLPELRYDICHL